MGAAKRRTVVVAAIATAGFVFAGCGGEKQETNTVDTEVFGTGPVLDVAADPDGDLKFTEDDFEVAAGKVVVNFTNESAIPHDFCIRDSEGVDLVCSDIIVTSTTTFDVDLEPGEYTVYCSLAGHRDNGMSGTLTVKES